MSAPLTQIIDRFSKANILVIGDLMLDRFIWGKVNRISPEAPVPVVHVTRESDHLGGAANVVSNIRALGAGSTPIGMVGEDKAGTRLMEAFAANGVDAGGLVSKVNYPTIEKTRIIAAHQQIVRVDREELQPLSAQSLEELKASIAKHLPQADAIIVSDYGKGVITPELLMFLQEQAGNALVCVDPKDKNFQHYRNAHIITPNQSEAERMSGVAITDEASLRQASETIFSSLNCQRLLITRGEHGMALFNSPEDMIAIPTLAREVFDVSGAGDTVIATYTVARAVGATPHQAALLANAAGGVVVGKLGTATLTALELKDAVTHL